MQMTATEGDGDGDGDEDVYPLRPCNIVFISSFHSQKLGAAADPGLNVSLLAEVVGGHAKKFPATIICNRVPYCSTMIFSGGRMHVVGTKTMLDALLATYMAMEQLRQVGVYPSLYELYVCNRVFSASVGPWIDLDGIAKAYPTRSSHTELFEGLHFTVSRRYTRGHNQKARTRVAILFETGKLVLTGCKSNDEAVELFRNVMPILRKFRCTSKPASTVRRSRKKRMRNVNEVAQALAEAHSHQVVIEEAAAGTDVEQPPTPRRPQRAKRHKPSVGYSSSTSPLT